MIKFIVLCHTLKTPELHCWLISDLCQVPENHIPACTPLIFEVLKNQLHALDKLVY